MEIWNYCGAGGVGQGEGPLAARPRPAAALPGVTAMVARVAIYGCSLHPAFSQWWHMESGGCREGSLSGTFDFTATDVNGYPLYAACTDPWMAAATGTADYSIVAPNEASILVSATTPAANAATFDSRVDSYLFVLKIDKVGSAPPYNCDGCIDVSIFSLRQVTLTSPGGDTVISASDASGAESVGYNTGGQVSLPPSPCRAITAARTSSWGSDQVDLSLARGGRVPWSLPPVPQATGGTEYFAPPGVRCWSASFTPLREPR